jgi:energy-coupling factor transporter ATP-binding protein EcfA2
MTQAEELRLHNLFIKFKNDGKSLDEIKMLLEVEEELLSKWDRGLQQALSEFQDFLSSDVTITGISNYGAYSIADIASLNQNKTQDTYQNAKNILPYCLKSLRCKAFDGINETGFEGLPLDTNWIFLIGENGYGKTTLLRAIALGLLGENEEDVITLSLIADEEPEIGVEYFSESQSFINNIGKPLQSLEHLACYGPSRLQIQTDQTKNDVAKKSTVTYSLFNSDGILLNIEFEMLIWFLEKNPRFEAVKQTILRLIPYLADIEVNVAKRMIYYIEKEPIEEGVRYNPVTFDQLASGFRSILAMVGDMMIRLFKSQPDITEPHELAGIVLIDELDLHWHPKMQREIPSLLTTIFPKVQFIASTHSLVPLLGAPENSVLLKVHRTAEEGVTVEQLTVDFQALSSDVLLRDIFELEKYMSDEKIAAWERYKALQRRIRGEEDKTKKEVYVDERRELAIKYNFPS